MTLKLVDPQSINNLVTETIDKNVDASAASVVIGVFLAQAGRLAAVVGIERAQFLSLADNAYPEKANKFLARALGDVRLKP